MNDTVIQAYVNAIKKGKLTINDVPEAFKEEVLKRVD